MTDNEKLRINIEFFISVTGNLILSCKSQISFLSHRAVNYRLTEVTGEIHTFWFTFV